jgi:hypothetical protein
MIVQNAMKKKAAINAAFKNMSNEATKPSLFH